ncbi:MerR family transcriptional regulator [Clostridium baratii]|uniref:MerR family transcriptional regulator n=1 Tax=Clostridium nitritogenes TaxID=83340 RepID=A0ABP3WYR7_9CLOT|nr:MerR family transcriptional regulator [Clostridium baratii]AQM60593.1 MerR family transcriptional regulator [Clostridium baratii]MBS6042325.1 MerR family transcriptional regulator [Clostridium baratii]MBT9831507.1 MerR family transcriptional regulator [Clostridium baratii]
MTIKEVSERFNLSQDTLRYYERIGLIPPINRNKSGIRDYTEEDCGWIEFIKCMRNAGLPIEVLIEYVNLFQKGDDTIEARKEILIEQRKQLEEKMNEMKKTIERLDNKILRYEDKILEKEKTLQKQVSKF